MPSLRQKRKQVEAPTALPVRDPSLRRVLIWARSTGPFPPSASQFWGGNSLAGNPCQRWLKSLMGFWRNAWQARGRGESAAVLSTGDWGDVVWPETFDWAPATNVDTRSVRHVVGEGALRGRSPRTREGRIGPTAQLQWSVVSGWWSEKSLWLPQS